MLTKLLRNKHIHRNLRYKFLRYKLLISPRWKNTGTRLIFWTPRKPSLIKRSDITAKRRLRAKTTPLFTLSLTELKTKFKMLFDYKLIRQYLYETFWIFVWYLSRLYGYIHGILLCFIFIPKTIYAFLRKYKSSENLTDEQIKNFVADYLRKNNLYKKHDRSGMYWIFLKDDLINKYNSKRRKWRLRWNRLKKFILKYIDKYFKDNK
jgi:hypothetical protein